MCSTLHPLPGRFTEHKTPHITWPLEALHCSPADRHRPRRLAGGVTFHRDARPEDDSFKDIVAVFTFLSYFHHCIISLQSTNTLLFFLIGNTFCSYMHLKRKDHW